MSNVMSLDSLKQRISAFYNEKQASEKEAGHVNPDTEAINMKDPQDSSVPQGGEPLKHDGDDASKMVLPPSGLKTTNNAKGENNIPGSGTSGEASGKAPSGGGEGGHSAKGGDAADEAVSSPTDPSVAKTSSVATQATALVDALRQTYGQQPTKVAEEQQTVESQLTEQQPKVAEEAQEDIPAEQVAADFNTEANAYHKVAELVLNYEEGRQLVNDLADREFGKEAASQLIEEAQYIQDLEDEVSQSELEGAMAADELLKNASEQDIEEMQKLATAHTGNMQNLEYDFEAEAYDLGCKQAAMAMDGGGEIPGAPDDVSLDEIAAVIMQMVEAGELDPETAEAVLQQLAGADQGGMEGGMPGGEMSPEEEAMMMEQAMGKGAAEELQKAASLIDQTFTPNLVVDEAEALRAENEALKQQLGQ